MPIIAQTAFTISGDEEKALSAGCGDYIPKPIDFQKLHDLIRSNILRTTPFRKKNIPENRRLTGIFNA